MTDSAAKNADASLTAELLKLNQRLLDSIMAGDWQVYSALCDPTISAFEAEARGHLVEGMPFHHFYFQLGKPQVAPQATMCNPHVRLLGDHAAVISYVRLTQKLDNAGAPVTSACEETRVWQRQAQGWRHVHFHRSTNT